MVALELPDPAFVEIVEQDGSICLLRYSDIGQCITDTWHQTVEEAKRQAEFEYELGEWSSVEAVH